MSLSVLITQCLQRDFVEPIERHEPLPNRLHVGWQEAARLAGEDPDTGPVAQLLTWAQGKDRADLGLVHVLDWHDPADPRQARHLEHFGPHCLKDTRGATLVAGLVPGVGEHIVHSIALNDFEGTRMSEVLDQLREQSDDGTLRVGVVGVWTEAKVTFLLYDLAT
ncbi:MAG: nicotinamidase-related amidase, partial [Myxococcota bacterium]